MIEIKRLGGSRGEFVLSDIDLSVNNGEYLVILGPTGAGKTVLLEYIAGIYPPDSGAVLVDGVDITRADMESRNIGYVPQDYCLFPNLSVAHNIGYGLGARGIPEKQARETVARILEALNIEHLRTRMPINLSGGERQRVALGRAIAVRPRLVLLDEPLSALDENLRTAMARELRRVQQELGGSFLHVCHNFEEAADVADRIAVMHEGRIVQTGTLAELMRKPTSEFVARFFKTINLFPADSRGQRLLMNGIELTCARSAEGRVLAGIRPEHITIENGAAAPKGNRLQAVVTGSRYKVSWTEIELDAGIPLVAHCLGEPAVQPGQQVNVGIAPEHIFIIDNAHN
jgi:ABC-type sugar transport system ATPase subunit